MLSRWLLAVALVVASMSASAAGVVEDLKGTLRVTGKVGVLAKGARFETGDQLVTGVGSLATLRFDDGQVVVLNEKTEFRVVNYRFDKNDASKSVSSLSLITGGLRVISGLIAKARGDAFKLSTPGATIGIRGTDFMVVVGPNGVTSYVSMTSGITVITTSSGVVINVSAGQHAFAQSSGAKIITEAELPASVRSAIKVFQTNSPNNQNRNDDRNNTPNFTPNNTGGGASPS